MLNDCSSYCETRALKSAVNTFFSVKAERPSEHYFGLTLLALCVKQTAMEFIHEVYQYDKSLDISCLFGSMQQLL